MADESKASVAPLPAKKSIISLGTSSKPGGRSSRDSIMKDMSGVGVMVGVADGVGVLVGVGVDVGVMVGVSVGIGVGVAVLVGVGASAV